MGNFFVTSKKGKRSGKSPDICFYITDHLGNQNTLIIETTYPEEYIKSIKINQEKDVSKYISDIIYIENGVWDSLITGNYHSKLTKINENKYKIELWCDYKDLDYIVNLKLDEEIQMKKEKK